MNSESFIIAKNFKVTYQQSDELCEVLIHVQFEFFWVTMLGSVVVGNQHFRQPCCLHLQGEDERI